MFSRSKSEILYLRDQVRVLQDANFRLTELLAQRAGMDLVLPDLPVRPVPEAVPASSPDNSLPPVHLSGWLEDMGKGSGHDIATPVREVPAPDSSKHN